MAPIIYVIFNRPDLTRITFEAIRQARPNRLYVVADGPRADRMGEAELCAATRAITEHVDWPCEVIRDYSDVNLGCGLRVSSGITNAFKVFEEAIILEDDCLPSPSFFTYCTELLKRYRDDRRVMTIGGSSFQRGIRRTPYSYHFSKYMFCWGWATWKRAWVNYDFRISDWETFTTTKAFRRICSTRREREHWIRILARVARGEIDTWDYQWLYAHWRHNGLTVTPEINLIRNLGFRPDATHTTGADEFANVEIGQLPELCHPPEVAPCREADLYTFNTVFTQPAPPVRLRSRFARSVRSLYRLIRSR